MKKLLAAILLMQVVQTGVFWYGLAVFPYQEPGNDTEEEEGVRIGCITDMECESVDGRAI